MVAWTRGASSWQVGQYRWRRGRSDDGSIRQRTPRRVKSYDGNHGKLGKIGEGHSIFGWPLWLRHVRSIIPGEHCTPADRPFVLLHATHIFRSVSYVVVCLVRVLSCLYLFTRLHMCLKMSHFSLHLRFTSSTILVLGTYDFELR